jgi:hypothetical protein
MLRHTFVMLALTVSACAMGPTMGAEEDSVPPISVPGDLLEEVRADAAKRSGRSVSELKVVSAEAVTWSDASLGCPQPEMLYAQVLTPGYRIVLQAGETRFDYHAGSTGKFVLCPPDRARPPSGAPGKT